VLVHLGRSTGKPTQPRRDFRILAQHARRILYLVLCPLEPFLNLPASAVIRHVSGDELFGGLARRPPYSVLWNYRLESLQMNDLADWQDGLSRYIG